MKLRTRIMCIGVLLVLILWIFVPVTMGVAVGNAVLAEVLVAIDDEELDAAVITDSEEPEEDSSTEYVIGVNCFDELHRKILQMDLSKVDDRNYIQGLNSKVSPILMGNGKLFPLKAYLRLYALAAEICLREEINPKGASVIINPTDLIGESFCEAGLMNYGASVDGYTSDGKLKDTVQVWLPEGYLTGMGVSGDALVQQQGGDWGSAWMSGTTASTYGLASCPSFFGQALFYSYCWSSDYGDVCVGVYISKEENPDLADDKRAIWGCRKAIYSGQGKYVTSDFWDKDYKSKLKNASSAELSANIKSGTFQQGKEFGYKTRPASYFLPDSMYTHALQIRSFLSDRAKDSNDMHKMDAKGPWSVSNLDKFCIGGNAMQREYLAVIKKMFVLSRFMGDSQLGTNFIRTDETTPGKLPAAYMRFVNEEIDPLVAKGIVGTDLGANLMAQSNSFCYVFIHGDSKFDDSRSYHLFTESESGPIELETMDGQVNGSHAANHTLYGFDCINAGALAYPAFKAQIEGAYNDYIKKYPPKSASTNIGIPKTQETAKLCWPLASTSDTIAKNGYYGKRSTDQHPGIDIIASSDAKVYSIAAGTITAIIQMTFAGGQESKCIIIEHGTDPNSGLTFCSWYSNVCPNTELTVGDEVSQRQPIGTVGSLTHEWCSPGYEDESGDYKQPSIEGRSFLHFSVCLYDKNNLDLYARYPDTAWEFLVDNTSHPEYASSSINPAYLDWYDSAKDDSAEVKLQTHDSADLKELYRHISIQGDNSESYRWNTSFNYQTGKLGDDEKTPLADAITNDSISDDFYGVSTDLTLTDYDSSATHINIILEELRRETISKQQNSYVGAGGFTSIFGISCGPPIPEQYFQHSYLEQPYGDPWENNDPTIGGTGGHAGIDISVANGCDILAVTDGTIHSTGYLKKSFGYNVFLRLKDKDGQDTDIYLRYCHMKEGSLKVKAGDVVKRGDVLGTMGNTGFSTGVHLHLELWVCDKAWFNQLNAVAYQMINYNSTPEEIRYYGFSKFPGGDPRPTLDPWLLYCMDPAYDWLRHKANKPPYTVFTYQVRIPGGQTTDIRLDPVGNPGFRDALKNPFNY